MRGYDGYQSEQNAPMARNLTNFVIPRNDPNMKKLHIILLVAIAIVIAGLLTLMSDITTYDTILSARAKEGKFVHMIAKLDKAAPIQYDPVKDPNYLSFYAVDSLGSRTQVVYHNAKPAEFEHSERIVLKGKMKGQVFECKEILLKCPSKYKDNPGQQMKELQGMPTTDTGLSKQSSASAKPY
jgi:cytochrome c-type biogenesis protein CcmE